MKKITLGCSVLAIAILFAVGCNKKTNPEPVQDKEVQSSIDASYANSVVTDLEQICGYLGDRSTIMTNFMAPGTTGSVSIDTAGVNTMKIDFTSSVTCRDGKKRNGTIIMTYTSIPGNFGAKFYRQPGFVGYVTLNNYWVDGWLVDDVSTFTITNKMVNNSYNPASEPLSWTMEGEISLTNTIDAAKNCTWKGKVLKKVTNSTNPLVFNPGKLFAIAWLTTTVTPGAIIEYSSADPTSKLPDVTGVTAGSKAYSFKITTDKPLIRQYSCAPDKVIGVTSTTTTPITILPIYSEWHPFVNGTASFTTSGLAEPRLINFGADDGSATCDNAGTVTIKGISYPIDFNK